MTGSATTLVLASASPARLATLRAAGFDPLVRVSDVDEPAEVARVGVIEAVDVALLLAHAKAADVAAQADLAADLEGTELVLGCDSVLELDGEVHGKPADRDQARQRWRAMRGRSGVLHTGHWLIDTAVGGGSAGAVVSTTVSFAAISDAEIEAYLDTEEPLGVAGAFRVDGLGAALITSVDGDYHSVVGVSPSVLRELVGKLGHDWLTLWRPAT